MSSPFSNVLYEASLIRDDVIKELNDDIGLRLYRMFLIREVFAGAEVGDGAITARNATEILPPPTTTRPSPSQVASMGGAMTEGSYFVQDLPRTITREQLYGRDPDGTDIPDNERFRVGFAEINGGPVADVELCRVSGEPRLAHSGWSLIAQPVNQRVLISALTIS